MPKSPTPLTEFVAQTRKAFRAFWVAAIGTAGTVVASTYAVADVDKVKDLDPYAIATAAIGAGLAAAVAVYRKANAGAKYASPLGGLEPQEAPHA